jgi:hypothetical protein
MITLDLFVILRNGLHASGGLPASWRPRWPGGVRDANA